MNAKHKGITRVTWEQLRRQIGSTYPDTNRGMRGFRSNVRKSITKIKEAWSEAGVHEWSSQTNGGLKLVGNTTPIEQRTKSPGTSSGSSEPKF